MMRLLGAAVLTCALAGPAYADVTVKTTSKGSMGDTPSVQYIKGAKMRIESSVMGRETVTIVDANAKQMIALDPATRQATIYDLSKMAEQIQKTANPSDVKVSMTPTGQTKQLLGLTCTEYLLSITFSITPPDMPKAGAMTMTIEGPMWIAKEAPGTKDFATFYKAAGESGLFFAAGGGRGGAQTPQDRGMAAMYKAYADAGGIPYEQQIQVKMNSSGPMADMMRRTGGQAPMTTITLTSVSTDPIPDDKFEIPAGYTKKNQ
jgi:hypothetical protein